MIPKNARCIGRSEILRSPCDGNTIPLVYEYAAIAPVYFHIGIQRGSGRNRRQNWRRRRGKYGYESGELVIILIRLLDGVVFINGQGKRKAGRKSSRKTGWV